MYMLCLVDCAVRVKQPHRRAVRDDVAPGVGGRTQPSTVEVRGGIHVERGVVEPTHDAQFRQHRGVSAKQAGYNGQPGEQSDQWVTTAERQHRYRLLTIVIIITDSN